MEKFVGKFAVLDAIPVKLKICASQKGSAEALHSQEAIDRFAEVHMKWGVVEIQDFEEVIGGYLIGADPLRVNLEAHATAMRLHDRLQPYDLRLESRPIRLTQEPGELDKNFESCDNVNAIHLICAKKDLVLVRQAARKTWNTDGPQGLPEGKHVKFVPHSGYTDHSVPLEKRMRKIREAKHRQRNHLLQHEVIVIQGVAELDSPVQIEGQNITLRQSLFKMTAAENASIRLFTSVDVANGCVYVAVDKSFREQGKKVVEKLPQIIAKQMTTTLPRGGLPRAEPIISAERKGKKMTCPKMTSTGTTKENSESRRRVNAWKTLK